MKEGEAELFSQNFRKLFRPEAICETDSVDLKSPTLKYVFKSSQNMIILKLGDFKRCPSQDTEEFLSPQIHRKSFGTLEKRAPDLY